jgi:hypothetical protein
MKHWNTLTELENSLIRLGEFKNLFELLTNGVDNGCGQEVINSTIYTMSGMIENINEKAIGSFHTLWEEIRQDSDSVPWPDDEDLSAAAGTVEEEEAWKNLECAIKNWKNNSSGD